MADTPFDQAERIITQIICDLGSAAVPHHLIGEWSGLISAEIREAQQNPSASIGRGTSSDS